LVTVTLTSLEEYVKELRKEIEEHLVREIALRKSSRVIAETLKGGKRLRPILLMLVFDSVGGKNRKRALDVACALELAHNASLTHDDIIDWDIERRGKPSLWRQVGISKAIIEGHRIINLAFQIALDEGVEIARVFLKAWDRASNGVLEELLHRELPTKTLYMRIIKEKTASLFEAAAESGAIIAGASPKLKELYRKYGESIGVAYQLADDYVDIVRGRLSLRFPIIMYQRLEEKFRQALISLRLKRLSSLLKLLSPRIDWRKFLVNEMIKAIKDSWKLVNEMNLREPYRSYLREFPLYCVNSMLREVGLSFKKARP